MSTEETPPDQVAGAPHPRETERLLGQGAAEAAFLEAFNSGRLHHGWLLTGPRGVGKATLAWRLARFLLATPPMVDDGLFGAPDPLETLDIDSEHPVARRIAAGSNPGIAAITRSLNDKGRMRSEIVVEDVRALTPFLGMSAADGGHRVVIVDSADEMNASAANALLKMLEEPPAQTTMLLISHQPSRLLPTIRSRCRTLRLSPLEAQDMAAALAQAGVEDVEQADGISALAGGSVGVALRLIGLGGMQIYSELIGILGGLPRLDRKRALSLAEASAQRGAAERFDLLLDLLEIAVSRLARTGAMGTAPLPEAVAGEAAVLRKLSPDADKGRSWAETGAKITARARHGQAVNLDPAAVVLDTVFKMQETAAG